jgi:hypothetical protein
LTLAYQRFLRAPPEGLRVDLETRKFTVDVIGEILFSFDFGQLDRPSFSGEPEFIQRFDTLINAASNVIVKDPLSLWKWLDTRRADEQPRPVVLLLSLLFVVCVSSVLLLRLPVSHMLILKQRELTETAGPGRDKRVARENLDWLAQFEEKIVRERMEEFKETGKHGDDFLGSLLAAKGADGTPLPMRDIRWSVHDMFAAGNDTTTTVCPRPHVGPPSSV